MKNIALLSLLTLASTGTSTISWNGKCVQDSGSRLLPTHLRFPYLTPAKCMEACQDQGFLFAGVQIGLECWCGNDAPPEDRIVDMAECDSSCSGDSTQKCGGAWRMNVYKIAGETDEGSWSSWSSWTRGRFCKSGSCVGTDTETSDNTCSARYSGTVVSKHQIATIDSFGPEYRVAFDIIVHSASSVWSSILRFTSTGGNCCNIGDRVPAIFYNSRGYLLIDSAVNEKGNHGVTYKIDLERWYHVEIVQATENGQLTYKVIVDGDEIKNVENTNPQSFEDVKVYAGGKFNPASDATYRNLIWENI